MTQQKEDQVALAWKALSPQEKRDVRKRAKRAKVSIYSFLAFRLQAAQAERIAACALAKEKEAQS